jgi:hypothetical protein
MRSLPLLGLLACLLAGCANSTQPPSFPYRSAGYTISTTDSVGGPAWKPGIEQIAQLESKVGALMAAPDRRVKFSSLWEKKCPFPLTEYAVRYHGEIRGGLRIVVGKATHTSQRGAERILRPPSRPDDTIALETFGGGSYFFTVTYDVASGEVLELRYNAPL